MKKGGPCRRSRRGLVVCEAMMMSLGDGPTGVQDFSAVTFTTGKCTRYVGSRRTRKEKVMLFNVCPFCRFEYAVATETKP